VKVYTDDSNVKEWEDLKPDDINNVVFKGKWYKEVRHGRWIHDGYDFPHGNDWVHCSVCGKRGINVPADLTPYCPNCGASMDLDEVEE